VSRTTPLRSEENFDGEQDSGPPAQGRPQEGHSYLPNGAGKQVPSVVGEAAPRVISNDMKSPRSAPLPLFPPTEKLAASPVERLRDLAAECRVFADRARDESTRQHLLSAAERFERLARVGEQGQDKAGPVRSD
jgi:hypothetical protein